MNTSGVSLAGGFIADVIVSHAEEHCGKAYGGFVRDFIINTKYNKRPENVPSFEDIDIWFDLRKFPEIDGIKTCQEKKFVEAVQESGAIVLKPQKFEGPEGQVALEYGQGFHRYDVYLSSNQNQKIFTIDTVVSDYFPVCDFNVNCFTYDGGKIEFEQPNVVRTGGSLYCFQLDAFETLKDILDKRMSALPAYTKEARRSPYKEIDHLIAYSPERIHRRIRKFESRGWKIIHGAFSS